MSLANSDYGYPTGKHRYRYVVPARMASLDCGYPVNSCIGYPIGK
ncbi:hypothetical protein EZS27_035416, partial [termite gut metagenome]